MPSFVSDHDAEALRFTPWLCAQGVVLPGHAYAALESRALHKPRIGTVALKRRFLTMGQSMEVLKLQAELDTPYGEIASEAFINRCVWQRRAQRVSRLAGRPRRVYQRCHGKLQYSVCPADGDKLFFTGGPGSLVNQG